MKYIRVNEIFLFFVFFLMCILKNPFTLFILFLIAIITTFFLNKNYYCFSLCPIGTMTTDNSKSRNKIFKYNNLLLMKIASIVYIVLFWIILGYIVFIFIQTKDYFFLWANSLRLMVANLLLATLFTMVFKKSRFYCIYLCPLRILILNKILKLRKKL